MCNGACDPAAGECKDVACITACVLAPVQCQTDADCGPGKHCEFLCLKGCTEPVFGVAPRAEKCQGMDCVGTCVDDPLPPVRCSVDADCPEGFVCEPVVCPMICIDDGQGGCLPCNEGFLGQCEPDAQKGCNSDAECGEGERCETVCTGLCPPGSYCVEGCSGVCVKKDAGCQANEDCPEGFYCELMCPSPCDPLPAGAEAPSCIGSECVGQCLPKPQECSSSADCPPGTACVEQGYCPPCVHSDPACAMPCTVQKVCVPQPVEGCRADSNCQPWQKCEVWCPMFCTPEDCGQYCVGQCVDLPE